MSDEDNKLFQTFGGRNKAIFVIVALLVAAAFFIAGAVMLGVGIHKANTKAVTCDNNVATTTSSNPGSQPSGKTNKPGTTPSSGASSSSPTQTAILTTTQIQVRPVPFYLTVVNTQITRADLRNDYPGTVTLFRDMIKRNLEDDPTVTVLSVNPENQVTVGNSFVADSDPLVGLIAVVYTTNTPYDGDDIKQALGKDGSGLSVRNIEDADTVPSDSSKQVCETVNPKLEFSTVSPPTTLTQPSTASPPTVTTRTTPKPTRAPDSAYRPCGNAIVFAIDVAGDNAYKNIVRTFLIENPLSTDYWNHIERLGLYFFSDRTVKRYKFGYFDDNSPVRSIDNARRLVETVNGLSTSTSNLTAALQGLLNLYPTPDLYPNVRSIVFVSQKLNQAIVDANLPIVNELKARGGLILVAVGTIDTTATLKYIRQFNVKFVMWRNPTANPFLTGWKSFFYEDGYGCTGPLPTDAASIGTEPTVTFPSTTTTGKPALLPCDGRIAIFLDRGQTLSAKQFGYQKDVVGRKIFSDAIFTAYQRLSIGSYDNTGIFATGFDVLKRAADVKNNVDPITQVDADGNLRKAFEDISGENYADGYTGQVTVIIFVSKVDPNRVTSLQAAYQTITDQGIRVVLVAHGTGANPDVLAQITGDSTLVFQWKVTDTVPARDVFAWFKLLINCGSSELEEIEDDERYHVDYWQKQEDEFVDSPNSDQFAGDAYPCMGNIVIGFDVSQALSPENFKKQITFLKDQVFNSQWTNYERLGMLSYATYVSAQSYKSFASQKNVYQFIDSDLQVDLDPYLRRALDKVISEEMAVSGTPSNIIIFVSKINDDIVTKCKPIIDTINDNDGVVTFVAMGKSIDVEKLKDLSPYVIQWDIDKKSTPDNWEAAFWKAYGCETAPPTEPPTIAPPPLKTTTEKPIPYVPCSGSEGKEIIIYFDNGNNLSDNEYSTMITFLQNKLFNYWTHFERLVLGNYNTVRSSDEPNFYANLPEVYQYLSLVPKVDAIPNVRRLFTSLVENPITPIDNFPKYFIIFISKITKQQVDYITPLVQRKLKQAKLTFVALKNVDVSLLKSIVPDVIDWTDMSQPEPKDWEQSFWNAYGCSSPLPTVPPPFTQPTKPTPPTTVKTRPTRPPRRTTTEAPPVPYVPCEQQIILLFDISKVLGDGVFARMKELIGTRIFQSFTHFERLGIGYYDNSPAAITPPTSFTDQKSVQQYLEGISQTDNNPVMRKVFQMLDSPDNIITNMNQTFVLLVGQMSDTDVRYSQSFADDIKQNKIARIAIIGVQTSVDQTKLSSLADYSRILDLSQPIPDNIEDIFAEAYGCPATP